MNLTGSIISNVGPAVIRKLLSLNINFFLIWFFKISSINSGSSTLPSPDIPLASEPIPGLINISPFLTRVSIFFLLAGDLYISKSIAGAKNTSHFIDK